jgi:hypothetical protein
MWTTNNLKTKITTAISNTVHLEKHPRSDNNNNTNVNNFDSTIIEKYSCWCILLVDDIKIDARINTREEEDTKSLKTNIRENMLTEWLMHQI